MGNHGLDSGILIGGTAVICERYAWSGVVYSYVSNPQLPLEAYMTCDQGIIQPDIVILLTTSPQESMGRKNAISPQFEDESIQQRLWDTFQEGMPMERCCEAGTSSSFKGT